MSLRPHGRVRLVDRFGIASRTAIALVASAAVLFGGAGLLQVRSYRESQRLSLEERANVVSDLVARTLVEAMTVEQPHQVRLVLEAIAASEGVAGLAIAFPRGTRTFTQGEVPLELPTADGTPRWTGDRLSITRPLQVGDGCLQCHEDARVGELYVALQTAPAAARAAELTHRLLLVALASVLLSAGLIVFIVRHFVSAPLRRLEGFARKLSSGELSARPPEEVWPETRELASALSTMAERLHASHDELERQVRDRTERLMNAERLAALGQMSAQVAHGLRNPLNAISGAVQYLRRVLRQEPVMAEYGALMEEEVARVNRFVDGLLRVARPAEPVREPADVTEVAGEALRRATLARGLEPSAVRLSLAPELPPLALDRRMVMEAIVNLLDNALEAGGAQAPELVTRLAEDGPAVLVEVLDRGDGIRPELADRLGRPFVTSKPAGTGLGLVIVAHAAQRHGGSFRLGARDGGGAAATLRFPLTAPVEVRA